MPQPTFNVDRFEPADAVKSISAHFSNLTATGDKLLMKFPSAGRITAASLLPYSTLAAGTVNYFSVGLRNAGAASPPAATTQVAAAVGGTAGVTAGTPLAMTVSAGSFAAGEWAALNFNATGTVSPDFSVQFDYRLDAF